MVLEQELRHFEAVKPDLERDHLNEWVLIKDDRVVGTYPSFERAASEAVELFDDGPYLIKRIGGEAVNLPLFALASI